MTTLTLGSERLARALIGDDTPQAFAPMFYGEVGVSPTEYRLNERD